MQAAVLQSDHQLHLHLTLAAHYRHASSHLCSLLNKYVNGIPWNTIFRGVFSQNIVKITLILMLVDTFTIYLLTPSVRS